MKKLLYMGLAGAMLSACGSPSSSSSDDAAAAEGNSTLAAMRFNTEQVDGEGLDDFNLASSHFKVEVWEDSNRMIHSEVQQDLTQELALQLENGAARIFQLSAILDRSAGDQPDLVVAGQDQFNLEGGTIEISVTLRPIQRASVSAMVWLPLDVTSGAVRYELIESTLKIDEVDGEEIEVEGEKVIEIFRTTFGGDSAAKLSSQQSDAASTVEISQLPIGSTDLPASRQLRIVVEAAGQELATDIFELAPDEERNLGLLDYRNIGQQ